MPSLQQEFSDPVTLGSEEADFSVAFLLLDAHHMALAKRRPVADFALSINDLRQIGLTDPQLHQLALKGLVKLGVKETSRSRTSQQFRWLTNIPSTFNTTICCVPTPRGILWARQCLSQTSIPYGATNLPAQGAPVAIPSWIPDQYELRHLGNAVLVYDKLAPNPFRLFDEFERHCWQPMVDNPFDPDDEKLRNTVKKVNVRLKGRPLYFVVRAGGRKAGWKLRQNTSPRSAPHRP